jgi:rhamnosyltransferase
MDVCQCAQEMIFKAPTKANIAAAIVSYNPPETIRELVERIKPQVGGVFIVDNGSAAAGRNRMQQIADELRVSLTLSDSNRGVAAALNEAVQWARARQFEWVLTLDQDSMVDKNFVKISMSAYHGFPEANRIGLIGVNYDARKADYRGTDSEGDVAMGRFYQAKTLMTSGSLVNIRMHEAIAGFRTEFFIDHVDEDYCLKLNKNGFLLIQSSACCRKSGQTTWYAVHSIQGRFQPPPGCGVHPASAEPYSVYAVRLRFRRRLVVGAR